LKRTSNVSQISSLTLLLLPLNRRLSSSTCCGINRLCFICETVYHNKLFVASMKFSVATKIFL
jgi:hypothetical protein